MSQTITILITDDDATVVKLLKQKLTEFKYRIITASDGQEAVQQCLDNSPDLVLMDIKMPVLDGIKATSMLREQGFKNPIIMLTASESEDDRNDSRQAGCNGYVLKSGDLSKLGDVIDMTLLHFM